MRIRIIKGVFVLNIFKAMGKFNLAIRLINKDILNIDTFVRSDVLKKQLQKNHGLIYDLRGNCAQERARLSAAMIDYINIICCKAYNHFGRPD